MKAPKNKPAGSPTEPAAPNPGPVLMPAPADYQFPSRKARREAELTGMIPIIVPKKDQPAADPINVAGTDAAAPSATDDAGTSQEPGANNAAAGEATGAPERGEASAEDGATSLEAPAAIATRDQPARNPLDTASAPAPAAAIATGEPQKKAADAAAPTAAGASTAVVPSTTGKAPGPEASGNDETISEESFAEGDDFAAGEGAAPKPVSALKVTGLPAIPVPQGPIAAMPAGATATRAPRTPKAGRDLPAAVSVGVGLLVLVIGSLVFYPVAFVALATAFACAGVWEVNRAIGGKGIKAPLTPMMVGALAMPASAYFAGAEGLLFALVASAGATVLWRSLDPAPGAVKSILSGVFTLMWIPFLLSFVFLMLRADHGPTTGLTLDLGHINPGVVQVLIMLLLVVANDTFGYLVGVLFGKHPMAPKISPKKSWEGFAGSLGGATLVAIPATVFLLDQHWWVGLALAIGMVFAGTGGDFAESMVKRELGVKDMSNLLPGHGGVMDRLDSILFAAPVAYAIFTVLGRF